jgi:hypothetical protein
VDWSVFRAAVSLHAHTHYSREVLSDLPAYISRIPLVGPRFDREIDRRRADHEPVDFAKGWWHPPVSPLEVFESEARQIDRRFGVESFVSITDHDDISAGLDVQRLFAARRTPVSVEWTVPFGEGFFHLGVHDLPAASARDWFARLAAFTQDPARESLGGILDDLHARDVLVVFNHPMWDLAAVGERTHARRLREFLDSYRWRLHAVELNGYRSWRENGDARRLASERGLPLISGGDRHACAPNALLNLTRATSFAEFAADVRNGVSDVVVMPEYRQHVAARILDSAADVFTTRRLRAGRQTWYDRVSCESDGEVRPLSHHWPDGGPLWVRSAVGAFRVASSPALRPVWRAALRRLDAPPAVSPIPTTS